MPNSSTEFNTETAKKAGKKMGTPEVQAKKQQTQKCLLLFDVGIILVPIFQIVNKLNQWFANN